MIRLHPRRAGTLERNLAEGMSLSEAARRAHLCRETLQIWVRQGIRSQPRHHALAVARAAGLELRRRRAAEVIARARALLEGAPPTTYTARGRPLRAAAKAVGLDFDALRMRLARARRHEAQTHAVAG